MSVAGNKAVAQKDFEEAWNNGKTESMGQYCAADYVHHDSAGGDTSGPDGYAQVVTMYRDAFPDLHFTLEDVVGEGDRVVVRWTATGTHRAEVMGIPATGKRVSVTGIEVSRFADGKLAETWVNWDALGLLRQLGAKPYPSRLPGNWGPDWADLLVNAGPRR